MQGFTTTDSTLTDFEWGGSMFFKRLFGISDSNLGEVLTKVSDQTWVSSNGETINRVSDDLSISSSGVTYRKVGSTVMGSDGRMFMSPNDDDWAD